MTIGELIEALAAMPRDLPVIIAKDAGGNAHSPLADAVDGFYLADSTYSGEVTYEGDEDEDEPDGVPAIILRPVN
jgi:hypothetical protein